MKDKELVQLHNYEDKKQFNNLFQCGVVGVIKTVEIYDFNDKKNISNEELVKLYQNGDKSALDELIQSNIGIIHKIANKYNGINRELEFDDLFQNGVIGFKQLKSIILIMKRKPNLLHMQYII